MPSTESRGAGLVVRIVRLRVVRTGRHAGRVPRLAAPLTVDRPLVITARRIVRPTGISVVVVRRTVTVAAADSECSAVGSANRIANHRPATILPSVARTRRVDLPAAVARRSVLRARATSALAETTIADGATPIAARGVMIAARGVMIGARVTMTVPGVTTAAQSILHRAEIARTAPDVPRCRSAVIGTKHADRPVKFRRSGLTRPGMVDGRSALSGPGADVAAAIPSAAAELEASCARWEYGRQCPIQ